ncbi:hypothetical protein BC937DRAFT_95225 [Endogone sp. FLAS-F59071]|nr:hypothetical protein BC937DRAFT_95225 [Endogone sp. FLAS-F59071]|eukprot:RUS22904.1 hypothetical protein BC937DRAFT_95225 [Endogone sp. FLAS-F59071]
MSSIPCQGDYWYKYCNLLLDKLLTRAWLKLNCNQLREIAGVVRSEGTRGAILRLQKILQNIEASTSEPGLFGDDNVTDGILPTVEEADHIDPDVQYVLDLFRFTCEMLGKGIPQRKNSERDVDVFIKTHIFSCFDDILDRHFGDMVSRASRDRRMEALDAPDHTEGFHIDWLFTRHDLAKDLPWGREFSLCERAGSKVENEKKVLSNTLKVQKTLKDLSSEVSPPQGVVPSQNLFFTLVQNFSCQDFCPPGSLFVLFSLYMWELGFIRQSNLPTSTYRQPSMRLEVSSKYLESCCKAGKEKFADGRVVMAGRLQEFRTPTKA